MRIPSAILRSAALASAAFLVAAPAVRAQSDDDGRYTAPRNATVDARGATVVRIHAEAGILRVEGRRGVGEVRVKGTARASRERDLDDIQLVAERRGNVVEVRADIPEVRMSMRNGYRGLDLVLEVPDDIALDVEDGSGDVEIRDVGDVDLRDGSGGIELTNVGAAQVEDGSGELKIRNARGDVTISDGSGTIDVRTVGGTVTVRADGSGSIDVSDVGGDFVVERDGSGGLAWTQVKGDVRVPRRKRG